MATCEGNNNMEAYSSIKNFNALDMLGYTKRCSEKRALMYEKIGSEYLTESIKQKTNADVDVTVAGSRGEGIAISLNSDFDFLFIQRNFICTEYTQTPFDENKIASFQLDFENVPCGYSKLRLLSFGSHFLPPNNVEILTKIEEALVHRNGHKYLRNDMKLILLFTNNRQGWLKQQSVFDDISGPARTLSIEINELHFTIDCVHAFKCKYPSVVDDWCKRERKHSWPSKDLVETVERLDVLVVPAGCKGSPDEELQWRISLTLAEQALVHSFNDIQIKLYAAMKMLAKHKLKPICDNITSYIVKNLIFRTFENTEITNITKDTFDETLLRILEQLKVYVTWKYLPNYMIPSKNMLENKVLEREKVELIRCINLIICNFKCPLVANPSYLFSDECEKRIAFSELMEQSLLAVIYVTPMDSKFVEKILHNDLPPMEFFKIFFYEIVPIIKRDNPMGLFDRLGSISENAFYCSMMVGIARGYHKDVDLILESFEV